MKFIKKHSIFLTETVYLLLVYYFSRLPLRDYDIWFHLKSGELFFNQGHLQFSEIFSYAAYHREWIPYEWLFQVIVYLLSLIGLWTIPLFMAIFVVIMQFFLLRIFDYIFNLKLLPRLVLAFGFLSFIYDFNTARPHVLAYSFVAIAIFMILARIFKGKKWIYLSPLLTLIWANLHSTVFLSWGLQLSFAAVLLVQYLLQKHKQKDDYFNSNLFASFRDLIILSFINFVMTILPPLGLLDYKLLWQFFQDRKFLGNFIAEWTPISENLDAFLTYSITAAFVSLLFLGITVKKRLWVKNLWVAPLILLVILGYLASRNLVLGYFSLFLIAGYVIAQLQNAKKIWQYVLFAMYAIGSIYFLFAVISQKQEFETRRLYYPVQSSEFAKKYLTGHMFNDYTYGGYVLYATYPKLQVFIDGRADVYHYNEMRDYILLSTNKYIPDKEYRKLLDWFWNKYDISFAIIATQKHNVMRRVSQLLNTDPNWSLIFWDDDSQIFVKHDGKNDKIIKQLTVKYATPYLRNPYVNGHRDEALAEYEKMDQVAKTARTSNAIGFIELQKGQYDQAKARFIEAVDKDPTFESPYMNLAELAAKGGDLDHAISLYYKAQNLAQDRGLTYIRLGQLLLQKGEDREKVRKIWQQGVDLTVDEDAKKTLKNLLTTL